LSHPFGSEFKIQSSKFKSNILRFSISADFRPSLLGLWYTSFKHTLDYTSGEALYTPDQSDSFECHGSNELQEIVEYWADLWNQHHNAYQPAHTAGIGLDLGIEWYRDVLRAKLVSRRLPRRLLIDYKEKLLGSPDAEID
jgi:hypothetical protein